MCLSLHECICATWVIFFRANAHLHIDIHVQICSFLSVGWLDIALKFTLFSLTNEAGDGEGES